MTEWKYCFNNLDNILTFEFCMQTKADPDDKMAIMFWAVVSAGFAFWFIAYFARLGHALGLVFSLGTLSLFGYGVMHRSQNNFTTSCSSFNYDHNEEVLMLEMGTLLPRSDYRILVTRQRIITHIILTNGESNYDIFELGLPDADEVEFDKFINDLQSHDFDVEIVDFQPSPSMQ